MLLRAIKHCNKCLFCIQHLAFILKSKIHNFEDSITLRSFQPESGFSVNLTYLFKIQL